MIIMKMNDFPWVYIFISFFNPQAIQYSINSLCFCTCYGQAPPCYTYSRSESYSAVETGADDFWHSPKSSCHGYQHWNQHLPTENQDKMHIRNCMFHFFYKIRYTTTFCNQSKSYLAVLSKISVLIFNILSLIIYCCKRFLKLNIIHVQ